MLDGRSVTSRADQAAATRTRILNAVRDLLAEGRFHDASMEAIAERARVTRVTLYRVFGSKQTLLEGLAWEALAAAQLDELDAAHALPDVRSAVRQVLRANCRMFGQLGGAMPLALELARVDPDMGAIIGATYHGRRHEAMERLATRVVAEGAAAPGWTKRRIADALLVLSSHEAYDTLVGHRSHGANQAGDLLFSLAGAFLR